MDKAKPNHPSKRPRRSERPNNRPYLQTFRTELRKSLTPAEASLWTALKNSQLDGRKFRRQHGVGNYILDFYCPAERLGVELDGQVHKGDLARMYDHERKLFLEFYRIKVIRFDNFLVFEDFDFVLGNISACFDWWKAESAQLPSGLRGVRSSKSSPPCLGGVRRRGSRAAFFAVRGPLSAGRW